MGNNSESAKRSAHLRYHSRRGVIRVDCSFCQQEKNLPPAEVQLDPDFDPQQPIPRDLERDMTDSIYVPDKGTPCRHLQYGVGTVLTADEEHTTIRFKIGVKKFITNLMQLDWSAEVPIDALPTKRQPKPRLKREPKKRVRGPSTEKRCRQALSKHSTSGHKGVSWDKLHGYWRAHISFQGHTRSLGTYPTAEQASAAYQQAARERDVVLNAST
jgi:hypothetical protein